MYELLEIGMIRGYETKEEKRKMVKATTSCDYKSGFLGALAIY